MRLLKIILVVFLIYFIRRFIQMYRVMKAIREEQELNAQRPQGPVNDFTKQNQTVVDADFKVVE